MRTRPFFRGTACSGIQIQRQRVYRRHQFRPQRAVNGAVASNPGLTGKFGRAQHDVEMAFAAAVIARMACVTPTVVADFNLAGLKSSL